MTRWTRLSAAVGLVIAGVGFAVFLIDQGLGKASLWASVLGLPVALIAAFAGVWSTALAIRSSREHDREAPPHRDISSRPVMSGEIHQQGNHGIAIAHTGSGDIHVTADAAGEQQDEPF